MKSDMIQKLEQYPNYSDDLNDIMNLFLNIEEYSEGMDLNKIIFISGSVQLKKTISYKRLNDRERGLTRPDFCSII